MINQYKEHFLRYKRTGLLHLKGDLKLGSCIPETNLIIGIFTSLGTPPLRKKNCRTGFWSNLKQGIWKQNQNQQQN